ncbi:uncharacterized protein SETTUDRAFT_48843, partial [Exserohilum turcica Et28A]
ARRSTSFRALRGLSPLSNSFSNGHTYKNAPTKYFYESTFNSHYDGRFASGEVPVLERAWSFKLMLKTYTETMEQIGIETWLMHGCLLGWWWNGGLMPWDKDLDFIMEEEGMNELAEWWNMTIHHFDAKDLGLEDQLSVESDKWATERSTDEEMDEDDETRARRLEWEQQVRENGKKYLLEVNPNYTNTSTKDKYNLIDARWIDVSNGLYIDITTLHVAPAKSETPQTPDADSPDWPDSFDLYPYSSTRESLHEPDDADDEIQMYIKDSHSYLSSQIFPLRTSTLEDVRVKIPYAYEELLIEEYGADSLTKSWFNGYLFDTPSRKWQKSRPTDQQRAYFMAKHGKGRGRISGTGRIGHGWDGR